MKRALDLFCSAGGASMGLHRAGFDVTGVDICPQPHYPFTFHQADALTFPLDGFDFVWASPPCQAHTALRSMPTAKEHTDMIPAVRAKLRAWGGAYIIENVPGAPLFNPVTLCGTMFQLGCEEAELRRHRLFESNLFLMAPVCRHGWKPRVIGVYGNGGGSLNQDGGQAENGGICRRMFSKNKRAEAMGITWMSNVELSQAIPPAYSEYLGRQIIKQLIEEASK